VATAGISIRWPNSAGPQRQSFAAQLVPVIDRPEALVEEPGRE
jgi:hypothetical protein